MEVDSDFGIFVPAVADFILTGLSCGSGSSERPARARAWKARATGDRRGTPPALIWPLRMGRKSEEVRSARAAKETRDVGASSWALWENTPK